ncbi:hypothetical protein [Azospirillum sp. TSO22-1]|uniref:hypothetical protein n=1 Tax=Azospirillum sp. TSO22-1 TaxID=716789 RepID=UPI000D611DC7|nr:hypothetical protein [Azospirillum sp. TSO22-1]PWC35223.1 hypothetical protein TSO221_30165 [Azospirillum sp. TSO22-1]
MATVSIQQRPRAARRVKVRTLVPLAGLLGVVIVTTALIGLFGLHYAHKGYVEDMRRVEAMLVRLDEARSAQVHFKKQVQEWKNLLLRGAEQTEYRRYHAAFLAEEKQVSALLGSLVAAVGETGTDKAGWSGTAERLRTGHTALGERYRQALAAHSGGPLAAADQELRGIDRHLDVDLESLGDSIRDEVLRIRSALEARSQERYTSLRQVAGYGLALCVLLVGLFLRAAVRREQAA